MALTDNNGTQYFAKPTGVASGSVDLSANNGSRYLWLSANDYILWGQSTTYAHVSANNGTQYYFYSCSMPSSVGLSLSANNGTGYYYTSSFNCVSF